MTNLLMRVLPWSARHGSALLGFGIFGGVASPWLAREFAWFITPNVVALVTLVLLRVDLPAAFGHLRRPMRVALIVAVLLLVSPLVAAGMVSLLPLEPGIAAGVVIMATGAAATSGAAFARLVGLDPELTLVATLASIFLVPLTGPPLAHLLAGIELSIGVGPFMLRLALVIGLPLLLARALRRGIGPDRLVPMGPAVDGLTVWLVVFYGFAVMNGMQARLLADPWWVAQATLAAFVSNLGLNLAAALMLLGLGRSAGASAGLMAGNRNMALYLAVLPASTDQRIVLFFALAQIPLFLSPFLLGPAYRQWMRR